MSKQRNPYWDIVKGVAILLVLWGHSIQCVKQGGTCYDDWVYRFIYSFHMPLFMFVCGYFFYSSICKYGSKNNLIHKVKTILVPLLCFAFIQMPLYYESGSSSLIAIAKLFLSCIGILWFLQQVFYCSVAVTLIKVICRDNVLAFVLLIIISLFFPNLYGLDRFSFMFPFFALGYLINKYGKMQLLLEVKPWKLVLSSSIYIVLLLFYNRDSFVYTSHTCIISSELGVFYQTAIDIYRIFIGCCGTYTCLLWLKVIEKKFLDKQCMCLQYVGKMSLGLYGFQTIYFRLCSENPFPNTVSYFAVIIVFLFSLAFSLTLTYIVSKIKLFNKLFLGAR